MYVDTSFASISYDHWATSIRISEISAINVTIKVAERVNENDVLT